jgi:glycine hydroxymethyltransferase
VLTLLADVCVAGTPALTTRGFTAADFDKVAEFFHRGVGIALQVQKATAGKKLVDFKASLASTPPPALKALQDDVVSFACTFPVVGFDADTMKYPGRM